jgi:4'-phosphopantetheinyl transferase EntD
MSEFVHGPRRAWETAEKQRTYRDEPIDSSPVAELVEARLDRLCDRSDVGLIGGCRAIRDGDDEALRPGECPDLAGAVVAVRRASGAARIVARRLIARLGCEDADLPREVGLAPRWPSGILGSLAHDRTLAVAVAAKNSRARSVGLDIEPAEPLAPDLVDIVATPEEQPVLQGDLIAAHLLFCVKEAVYKATHPIDGVFLAHHDIQVNGSMSIAATRNGFRLQTFALREPALLALAVLL